MPVGHLPGHAPPALARQIDRLARRAHAFHRFAHHPLCPAYAGEVLHLGRRLRVCRGCAFTGLGAVFGVLIATAMPAPPTFALACALLVALPWVHTSARRAGPGYRLPKLFTRAVPTAWLTTLALWGLYSHSWSGLSVTVGAGVLFSWALRTYRRRGPDRTPCAPCPEKARGVTCTGFAAMARRERAFTRRALQLLGRVERHASTAPPLPSSPLPDTPHR